MANTRLFAFALAAERLQEVESAVDEAAEVGQILEHKSVAPPRDNGELERRAYEHVLKINYRVQAYGKARGGISITDYARVLDQTSGAISPLPKATA
jgi:hypothetical protein